ncbi:hypothetical protein DFH27DRAFT_561090 [Peziza echinospora]|nr:hypothetical protein DFH27DRAFT_561090 [Peziza echinospora]
MAYTPELSTVDLLEILAMGQPTTSPDTPPPQKSPPPAPLAWVWKCHGCKAKWAFRAVHRCLSCSHRFCGQCQSELDFTGWNKYEAYWGGDKTEGKPVLKWQGSEFEVESPSKDEQDEENEHEERQMDVFEWDDDADVGSGGSGDREGSFDPSYLYDDGDTTSEENNESP